MKLDQGHIDHHAVLDQCVYDISLALSLTGISFILDVFISHALLKSIILGCRTHQTSLLQSRYYLLLCHNLCQSQLNEDNNNFTLSFISQ